MVGLPARRRAELRRREPPGLFGIEHRLAHVSQRQGRRARHCGARINLCDLRRCCAIQNLETSQRSTTLVAEWLRLSNRLSF